MTRMPGTIRTRNARVRYLAGSSSTVPWAGHVVEYERVLGSPNRVVVPVLHRDVGALQLLRHARIACAVHDAVPADQSIAD